MEFYKKKGERGKQGLVRAIMSGLDAQKLKAI